MVEDAVRADIRADIEMAYHEEIPDAKRHGSPVFLLQPVPFNDHVFNFMYDSGCESFVSQRGALDFLPSHCKKNVWPGPVLLHGVGGCEVTSKYGHYEVKLPIFDGRLATFSGLCLDTVTGTMPPYPVREVRQTIVDAYVRSGGKESDLPNVPSLVGGETDFLFGMAYNWFLPQRLFVLPSGLAIYRSVFVGVDGTRGCIGGSHELFAQCEKQFFESNGDNPALEFHAFLRQRIQLFNDGFKVCLDYSSLTVMRDVESLRVAIVNAEDVHATQEVMFSTTLLSQSSDDKEIPSANQCSKCLCCPDCSAQVLLSTRTKLLGSDGDAAGTIFDYRCPKCRDCADCKSGEHIESISIRAEREQSIIDASVSVDFQHGRTEALLPFMEDPAEKLIPNKDIALKVYRQQTRKLSRDLVSKEAVLKSEDKLQQAGHVEWLVNLTKEQIENIKLHIVTDIKIQIENIQTQINRYR